MGSTSSARSGHTVHTRIIRRADTRAGTEPRPGTELETTVQYTKDFEPREAGRESLPYAEIVVSPAYDPAGDSVDVTRPRPKAEVEDKTLERRKPELDDLAETLEKPKADLDAVLREIRLPVFANGSGAVAAVDDPPADPDDAQDLSQERTMPGRMSWLGVAMSAPEVGASLVIGAKTRHDFHVTSPVTHVFARDDGMLVQTATKSRYFVERGGDAYLVRKSS